MTVIISTKRSSTAQPSAVFKGGEIAELALQKIGAFSTNDTAADPVELARTLEWMDLLLAEVAGRKECYWLHPVTIEQAWPANTASKKLKDFANYPSLGIVYPVSAWLRDSSGRDTQLELQRRYGFESVELKTISGRPDTVHIDRTSDPTVYVNPVPTDASMTIRLVVQTYNQSVLGNVNRSLPTGDVAVDIPREFQRWLVIATAADIADGPVRRLTRTTINDWKLEAKSILDDLMATANREHQTRRRTKAWGV